MKLGDLISTTDRNVHAGDTLIANYPDVTITGLSADSRTIAPGFLFAALSGSQTEGTKFIHEAIANGAAAILTQADAPIDDISCPIILSPNPRKELALIAAKFYGSQPDTVVAVTGTNGKSSVAHFTRQIFEYLGLPSASLGTLGVTTGGANHRLRHTTPDPIEVHSILSRLAHEGISHVALEASSHGLEQYRLDGVKFAAAAFTNLSQDHLDYHASMDSYFDCKARLFRELLASDATAVLNMETEGGRKLARICDERNINVIGIGAVDDLGQDGIRIVRHETMGQKQSVRFRYRDSDYDVDIPLVGEFQVSNAAVAAGLAIATGEEPEKVFAALAHLKEVPGRLQRIGDAPNGASVYVDYAHTPEGIATVLKALRPFTPNRLFIVFGAGGDRDPGKRPLMGAAARACADCIYLTDDNPRHEDPATIRAAVHSAVPDAIEIGNRYEAIKAAIHALEQGDVLVIAGKGHETGQIIGDEVRPFDDRKVAEEVLVQMKGDLS